MKKTSIKINLLYQSFYEILIIILPLFTSPYISRVLGAEKLGIFSYTFSIAYYFQLFGMLGLKFYGNRTIAQARDDKKKLDEVYSEILVLHILFSVISLLLYILYSVFLSEYPYYSLIQGVMVLSTVFDVSWLFFGLENFKTIVKRNSVIKILSVVLIFLLVKTRDDLWIYILISASAQLLGQVVMFVMAPNYVHFVKPRKGSLSYHIKPLLILFVPVIALSLFKYMDKIMLGVLGDKVQLGFYENSEKILNIPLSVILAFGSVMLPKISNMVANKDDDAVDEYMGISIKYMLCLAYAMTFGMAGIANVFSSVFWGEEFNSCGLLIQLLAISLPFSTFANIIRNQDLIPRKKDKYYSYAIVCGAVSNLVINFLLIPKYQAIGVTIGTIISEILVCLVQFSLVRKDHNYLSFLKPTIFFIIPGVVMYIAVFFIGELMGKFVWTLLIQILAGFVIYGGISLLYFWYTKDEKIMGWLFKGKKSSLKR